MRLRIFVSALAIVALAHASVATADLVKYDDFSGTAVDTSLWGIYDSAVTTVADSVITIDGSTDWTTMRSTQTYDPTVQQSYEFKFMGGNGGQSPYFGLATETHDRTLVIRRQDGVWKFAVSDGVAYTQTVIPTPSAGAIYDFKRTADKWELYQQGDKVAESTGSVFDTGMAMHFMMQCRPHDTLSLDYVGVNSVPEPSMCVMVGMGLFGLLAYAWRRRK